MVDMISWLLGFYIENVNVWFVKSKPQDNFLKVIFWYVRQVVHKNDIPMILKWVPK